MQEILALAYLYKILIYLLIKWDCSRISNLHSPLHSVQIGNNLNNLAVTNVTTLEYCNFLYTSKRLIDRERAASRIYILFEDNARCWFFYKDSAYANFVKCEVTYWHIQICNIELVTIGFRDKCVNVVAVFFSNKHYFEYII